MGYAERFLIFASLFLFTGALSDDWSTKSILSIISIIFGILALSFFIYGLLKYDAERNKEKMIGAKVDELEDNIAKERELQKQLVQSYEMEKLNPNPKIPMIIKINGKIVKGLKGKNPCDECGSQTHSRYTDGSGNKRAIKIVDKGDFKIKIYEYICPYSHTKYVMKIEEQRGN